MGISCGQGLASHNASTTSHAAGLTTLANCYVAAAGKIGYSDAYFTRYGASTLQGSGIVLQSDLDLATTSLVSFSDAQIKRLAANIAGMATGDCFATNGLQVGYKEIADAAYSVLLSDFVVVLASATAGRAFTVPAASSHAGRVYIFKNLTVQTLTISPTGGDTVEGGHTTIAQYDTAMYISDGVSVWRCLAHDTL